MYSLGIIHLQIDSELFPELPERSAREVEDVSDVLKPLEDAREALDIIGSVLSGPILLTGAIDVSPTFRL